MADSDYAPLIAESESDQIGAYFAAATAGLFAYEYAITFSQEVELFWKRKVSVSSVLFIVNRYLPFVVNMIYAPWPVVPITPPQCTAFFYIAETLEILQYLPWAVFSGLRAYALSARSWPVVILVFLLSIVPIIINYITMSLATAELELFFGCGVIVDLSDSMQQNFTIISRISLITSDLLVLGITWYATFRTSREIKALGQTTSLSTILFRDGVVYFMVLLIMNILHLTFSLLSVLTQDAAANASYITILTEPITAILISRFLIDLQEANNGTAHQNSLTTFGTIDFNRVLGSLGSSLPAPGEASDFIQDQARVAGSDTEEIVEDDVEMCSAE